MNKSVREFYNNDLKMEFINEKLSTTTSYINAYNSLFNLVKDFELFYNKDLYSFTIEDILTFVKSISPQIRFTSAVVYNELIKDYKKWLRNNNPNLPVVLDNCSMKDLKSIDTFKKYTIFNDEDIINITHRTTIDGGDYLSIIFIRLLWEIDAQEDVESIITIKIQDLDIPKRTIKINHTYYKISEYLTSLIKEFAFSSTIEYKKSGVYKIATAMKNGGYIFRTRTNRHTILGEPLTVSRFSDLFHDFVEQKHTGSFNINDIIMSLALKHMLTYKKSHVVMQSEKRYFSKVTSHTYGEVLLQYGKEKFPKEYENYLQFYNNLKTIYLQ